MAKTLVGHLGHRKVHLMTLGAATGQQCSAAPRRHKLYGDISPASRAKHSQSTATAAPSLHQKERGTRLGWGAEAQELLSCHSSPCRAPIRVAISRACVRQPSYTDAETNTLDTGLT